MGPGPSDVSDRVLRALGSPTIGHLDPEYLRLMDELRQMLRAVFKTKNELTLAVSATGMAGMEACVANIVEPGDTMAVCINGVFGSRMADVAERCGASVVKIEAPWGEVIDPQQVADALKAHPEIKALGIVHAETSTGAHQPMDEIAGLVRNAGALLVLDTVTSLGGVDVRIDDWGVDACYSGTQKCLSCPPGLSPVTFSGRAVEAMEKRKTKCQSWYLDMAMVRNYWGGARSYHHTAPVNMTYALHQALAIVLEEGLEARFTRHRINHVALRAGLEAMGIKYIPKHSLTTLNCVSLPEGVDDKAARGFLLKEFNLEIGGGLGPFAGKAWRIGLMGTASTRRNVLLCLSALEAALINQGATVESGAATAAAEAAYSQESSVPAGTA